MRKVLVTGSREWTDKSIIGEALGREQFDHLGSGLIVIQGGARGADKIARELADTARDWWSVTVPAKWGPLGMSGGPRRNEVMLELGPDVVLAFFKSGAGNRGTSHMAKIAREAGLEVKTFSDV